MGSVKALACPVIYHRSQPSKHRKLRVYGKFLQLKVEAAIFRRVPRHIVVGIDVCTNSLKAELEKMGSNLFLTQNEPESSDGLAVS